MSRVPMIALPMVLLLLAGIGAVPAAAQSLSDFPVGVPIPLPPDYDPNIPVPAAAQSLSDARAAYERGDYGTAHRGFLGFAEQGDADAQFDLGVMYYDGQGVPQDHAEAVKWFRRAAEQGLADAQSNLGGMYYEGQGVPQDHAEAAKWFRRAAEQGNTTAQFYLGLMLETGTGVPQDHVVAHMWFNLSAAGVPAVDKGVREHSVRARDRVEGLLSPEALSRAQRMAVEWKLQKEN